MECLRCWIYRKHYKLYLTKVLWLDKDTVELYQKKKKNRLNIFDCVVFPEQHAVL